MFSSQKVSAEPATSVYVGQKELTSSNNYTADGTNALLDLGEGNRANGYALFDAATGTLTLHNFITDQTCKDNNTSEDVC